MQNIGRLSDASGLTTLPAFGTDESALHAQPLEAGHVIRLADALVGRLDGTRSSAPAETPAPAEVNGGPSPLPLPFSRTPFRRDEVEHNLLLFAQASYHASNVAEVQD